MTQIEELLLSLADLPATLIYLVIFVLAALENIFPPVPADTAVALGAFISGTGRISAWSVFGVTWLANVGSAITVYALARHLGRPFFRSRVGERLLRPAALARLEIMYRKHGTWGIFLSRFVPALRAVVPPFAGVAGVGVAKACLPVAVASAIWYGTITYVAATVVREFNQIKELILHFNVIGGVVAGLILMIGVVWWLQRRGRAARKSS